MAVGYQDYYEALGVPRDASNEDIRRAYRRLAREYHPDVNKDPGAEDRFKEISEAYEVLRDPEKRERYDRLGSNWRSGQDVSGAPGFEEYFSQGRGAPDGFEDVRVQFGGDGDFSDLFEGLFGGRGGRRSARRAATRDAVLELDLEEAARGGRRRVTLGDGREFEVDIPPGVRDGEAIRVPGANLLLRIQLRPHRRFRFRGDDLETDVDVAPWEAALGAEVRVPTLDGGARVKVPAGSSCGRRLRLRGAGLGGSDLYAVVRIVVPKKLSRKERELFRELADTSKFDPRRS
ncbi:DnaJ domain-containing protein [Candidatus Solirubrobacter pratensis]|uniref:DnaJ domain-containing protein n=1 Tax=Candidatus Solirubrobacter pratensis TaxID=1298857 RepID=UPI0003FD18D0|nr:DnaJ domain-containing protein [Candidatus Solirubrobacter pratensis]